jgi:hypothetical protein
LKSEEKESTSSLPKSSIITSSHPYGGKLLLLHHSALGVPISGILMNRVAAITGFAKNPTKGGVAIRMQMTPFLLPHNDTEGARDLKLLVYIFETMSSLKINFEKSENNVDPRR